MANKGQNISKVAENKILIKQILVKMSKYQMPFCISVIFSICIITIESCETPDNLPGVCKSLLECPVLLERFKANKSDPYLKQCACGIRNVINLICI